MTALRERPWLAGIIAMLFGLALVLGAVLWMNRPFGLPGGESGTAISQIEVEKKEKPKPDRQVAAPRAAEAPATARAGATGDRHGFGLSGLDFGLPSYEAEDLSALGGNLLGDDRDVVMTDSSSMSRPPVVQTAIAYPARAKAQGVPATCCSRC
jgi:periplasmic protein TonB